MDNTELLAEIRLMREDMKELQKEFYIFKGKAFGFITLLSFLVSFIKDLILKNN